MLAGVLFDFDGTIFSNEKFHSTAIKTIFEEYSGGKIDEDELRAYAGLTYVDRLAQICAARGIDDDELIEELEQKARKHFLDNANMHEALVPGVVEIIQSLHGQQIKLGVVSSARHSFIDQHLEAVGLLSFFDTITGRDDVKIKKPHPQPYEKTMEHLGLLPKHTVAFEDSPPGVEAALLAGLPVIALLTTFHEVDLAKADKAIHDYTEITVHDIEQLTEQ